MPSALSPFALLALAASAPAQNFTDTNTAGTASQPITVDGYAGDGAATASDANPALKGVASVAAAAPGAFSADVAAGVRTLRAQGATHAGLRLARTDYQDHKRFDRLSWSAPRPTPTYANPVPEPSVLAALGLGALALLRRRRR